MYIVRWKGYHYFRYFRIHSRIIYCKTEYKLFPGGPAEEDFRNTVLICLHFPSTLVSGARRNLNDGVPAEQMTYYIVILYYNATINGYSDSKRDGHTHCKRNGRIINYIILLENRDWMRRIFLMVLFIIQIIKQYLVFFFLTFFTDHNWETHLCTIQRRRLYNDDTRERTLL